MRISVIIPLYNKSSTVLRAINSVFRQTSLPEEILVVNDGSNDGSENVILGLDNKLIKVFNQENAGVSSARNKGIAVATGDWIAFLDADDEWMPEYLETIKSLHCRYPECTVIATSYYFQYPDGSRSTIIVKKLPFKTENGVIENYFKVAAYSHPPVWTSAVVVSKSVLSDIKGFPEGISSGEDLLTWAKLALRHKIAYSRKSLSIFIQDANAVPRLPQKPDIVAEHLRNLLGLQSDNRYYIKKYISLWHKMRMRGYLELGHRENALKEFIKSVKYNIISKSWILLPLILLPEKFIKRLIKRYKK